MQVVLEVDRLRKGLEIDSQSRSSTKDGQDREHILRLLDMANEFSVFVDSCGE